MSWWNKKEPKKAPRIVKVTQGYIPQVYSNGYGIYSGISSDGETWATPNSMVKYCCLPTRKEANTILEDYVALTAI